MFTHRTIKSPHNSPHIVTMKNTTFKVRSYDEYIRSLQEERRKIQVFHRELPLCLDLVDQAIENYNKQVCSSDGEQGEEEEGKSSNEGPVLEEFIPLKAQEEDKSNNNLNEKNESKADWLKSAQLWNQKSALDDTRNKENGHAFIPFQKINSAQTTPPPPESTGNGGATVSSTMSPRRQQTPTASTSSTADTNLKRKPEKESDSSRKMRRCWSPELHRRFLLALQQLGGSHAATPKQIRELMKVDGLTNDEVKSHLQKYRLHTRTPSGSSAPNAVNTQSTQYVLVGGIWAPPQNYPAVTTKAVSTSPAPNRIYVPVAAPPPVSARQMQQQRKQLQLSIGSSHSEQKSGSAEHSMGAQNAHSGSLAATSSTETTTASPHF